MSKIRKALFVTHEGFSNSIFRSQVIEHCESLSDFEISFNILTYETFRKARQDSFSNLSKYIKWGKIPIHLNIACNIYLPFSTVLNYILLVRDLILQIRIVEFDFIHARADYTAFLCLLAKPIHKKPVIWDCRGDNIDELKFAIEKFNILIRLAMWIMLVPRQVFMRFILNHYADKAIFVSDALRDVVLTKGTNFVSHVIPCPVPTSAFYFSNEVRDATRKLYAIPTDSQVFIYSGSMIGYQSIDEFMEYYDQILLIPSNILIIATIDKEVAKLKFKKHFANPRLLIVSLAYEEMSKVYCAADFAIMIRSIRKLNWVASPTKFGEYCLCGLPVIHNSAVKQVVEVTKQLESGYSLSDIPFQLSNVKRSNISDTSKHFYGRESLNKRYLDCYSNL
jgi:hypothetical protein